MRLGAPHPLFRFNSRGCYDFPPLRNFALKKTAEIFGRADYGAIQGMISAPATLSKAISPFAFGALWALAGGYNAVLAVAVTLSLATFISFAVLVAARGRPR